MATTEQRSGFRLPWASDARPGTLLNGHPGGSGGSGGSDGAPDADEGATTEPTTAEANEMQETTIPDVKAISWPDADSAAESEAATGPETVAYSPAEEPAPVMTRARRDNPLVTGLVRAMRDAAATARQESAARFAEDAKARVEAIHAQSAEEATELRKQADTEVVEIRDWSKAEMARIREETDERIAARRRRLETDVETHASSTEHRIERVKELIVGFEDQMNGFFEQLLAEEDPARLAGLAEQLPEPPDLDLDDGDDWMSKAPAEVLDARGAAAAEAEALVGLDETADADEPAAVEAVASADADSEAEAEAEAEAETSDANVDPVAATDRDDEDANVGTAVAAMTEAADEAAVAAMTQAADEAANDADDMISSDDGSDADVIPEEDVVRRLEAFTGQATPAVEASVSRLAVTGLVSVASIAGFKRGLARTHGVRSVTVASGPSGDFVFTVAHDPETDLASAVPALEGFAAAVTGDADGVLSVTATDPESAH
jgi:hypothetical protein